MHRGKRSSKIQMDEMNPEDLNDDVDSCMSFYWHLELL